MACRNYWSLWKLAQCRRRTCFDPVSSWVLARRCCLCRDGHHTERGRSFHFWSFRRWIELVQWWQRCSAWRRWLHRWPHPSGRYPHGMDGRQDFRSHYWGCSTIRKCFQRGPCSRSALESADGCSTGTDSAASAEQRISSSATAAARFGSCRISTWHSWGSTSRRSGISKWGSSWIPWT